MKGIGTFVALLVIAGGVAIYFTTRPPDRNLDAQGQAWVDDFRAWRSEMAPAVDRAEVSIGVSRGDKLDPTLVPPLRTCASSLVEIGEPPTLLVDVLEVASAACGEVEYALSLNDQFGRPSLASVKQHLHRGGRRLVEVEVILDRKLSGEET